MQEADKAQAPTPDTASTDAQSDGHGTHPVARRSGYAYALDGLRAICALGVVFYHMGLRWMGGGFHGVTVLFVLAGYFATTGIVRDYRRHRGSVDLIGYWMRRIRRLMPTVLVFVVVTTALCSLFSHVMLTKMRPDIIPGIFMYINWAKIFRAESYFAQAGSPSPLTHFWTLAIEWQFYLFFPPILIALLRIKAPRRAVLGGLCGFALLSAVLMAILYGGGSGVTRAYYGTDTRAMSLLLGCAFALFWPFDAVVGRRVQQLPERYRSIIGPVGVIATLAIVAIMVLTDGYGGFTYYGGTLLVSVLALASIASCIPVDTPLSRALCFRPLTWIGERSYAIYLWHYPIVELLTRRNAAVATPIWRYLLMLALTLLVSELSYRLVEQPLRKRTLAQAWAHIKDHMDSALSKLTKGSTLERSRVLAQATGSLLLAATCLIAGYGLIAIPAVNALGDAAGAPRVSKATLRKPLTDGVYDVVFIGDSVALGASDQLNAAFPHGVVNVEGSREAYQALEILREYEQQGVVGDMVVIHMGTNGMLDDATMEEIVDTVGPNRQLWLVNDRMPDNRMEPNNECIQRCVNAHNNVHLIDWAAETEGHSEYLDADDGIHLTYEGRDAYGALVPRAMNYITPDEQNTRYDVTLIGDLAALSAADELAGLFKRGVVDCAEGRDPAGLASTYRTYADAEQVGQHVVLCLGADLPLTKQALDGLLDEIGSEHTVWLVNSRTTEDWCVPSNKVMADAAAKRENVSLIDWYSKSDNQLGWFGEDGTTLTAEGAAAYVEAIDAAMSYSSDLETANPQVSDEDVEAQEDAVEEGLNEDEPQESEQSQEESTESQVESDGEESSAGTEADEYAEDSESADEDSTDYEGYEEYTDESYDYSYDDTGDEQSYGA